MLSIFGQDRQVLIVSRSSLPSQLAELQQHILSLVANRSYQFVQFYDQAGLPVSGPIVEPYFLSYAVVASSEESASHLQPIKITLRKTDKTGFILFKHPQTTAEELKKQIQSLTGVPLQSQELIHRGQVIDQLNLTLENLNFLQSPILHLVDLSQKEQDVHQLFPVYVQAARVLSQVREFIVSGACTVAELKSCVSQTFAIPLERLLVTYCGRLLYKDDATLYQCNFVPGAYINVLQEKEKDPTNNKSVISIDSTVKSSIKASSPSSSKENQNSANTLNFSLNLKDSENRKTEWRSVFGSANTSRC